MTLHIFNPEHDIALASGLSNFTAPHAGRQLRHDLGYLPAIWAREDDVVVVDDPEYAAHRWKRLVPRLVRQGEPIGFKPGNRQFLAWKQLQGLADVIIEPWGWNSALRAQLIRSGLAEQSLPSMESMSSIREMSHRRVAASLLRQLRCDGTVGESTECYTVKETEDAIRRYGKVVLKAPWSSSGRGLRFCNTSYLNDKGEMMNENGFQTGWLRNVLASQGSVMVEPYYNKVKDFGMEFESDGSGLVRYLGLSLFHTQNGAYTGNVLASEAAKTALLCRDLPADLLQTVREEICQRLGQLLNGVYCGPFGVDMMVCSTPQTTDTLLNDKDLLVKKNGYLLHPCVEINLRRTMGHVALAMSPHDDDIRRVMRIEYSENVYKLKVI